VSSSEQLRRRKRAFRATVRGLRDGLASDDRTRRSDAVAERLLGLAEVRVARTVMAFSSFGSEVQTAGILERLTASGQRIVLPRVADREIEGVEYRPGDPMRIAAFGALEPLGQRIVPPNEIDVVVTPGLAFDRAGYRVGYGSGFYDRFFLRTRSDVVKVGVAFTLQVVSEVPHGWADVPVDLIVTEEETIRCRPGAAPAGPHIPPET
jgi:5-formyltetrahydrofolate cyclo-ligase